MQVNWNLLGFIRLKEHRLTQLIVIAWSFFMEEVILHVENKKSPSWMKFYIKWLKYDWSHNSWEPWKSMRATDQLYKYLHENDLQYVLPR